MALPPASVTLSFSLPPLVRDYIYIYYTLSNFDLLLGDDFKTFLDVDGQVDDDLVGGAAHFVVLEENVRSELRDCLVYHIISV